MSNHEGRLDLMLDDAADALAKCQEAAKCLDGQKNPGAYVPLTRAIRKLDEALSREAAHRRREIEAGSPILDEAR